jgi:hypothetical protein
VVDGGEPQVAQPGEGGVVVADQGEVPGHPQAALLGGRQRADAGHVVDREDGGGAEGAAQEPHGGPVAALLGEVALLHGRRRGQAVLAHGGLEAAAAQLADRAPAGDVGDVPVAEADEVLGGQPGPELVVPGDDVHAGQDGLAGAGDHGGDTAGGGAQRLRVVQGADGDQTVDAQVGEGAGQVLPQAPVEVAVGEQYVQTAVVQPRVQAVEQVDVPGVAQVVQQDADGAGAAFAEAAGGGVGPVAELLDGGEDGRPLLRSDAVRPPQDQRDQGLRHAGARGDVADGRGGHGWTVPQPAVRCKEP